MFTDQFPDNSRKVYTEGILQLSSNINRKEYTFKKALNCKIEGE